VLKDASSLARLSVPVIYFDIRAGISRTSPYKLFARVYGGKYDEDIDRHNINTVTKLKMVSLYDFML
jgi:hypothetical protein